MTLNSVASLSDFYVKIDGMDPQKPITKTRYRRQSFLKKMSAAICGEEAFVKQNNSGKFDAVLLAKVLNFYVSFSEACVDALNSMIS